MLFSIISLLFHQCSISILHAIYKASLIYVILCLVESFFVVVDSLLELSNIADLCLFKVNLSLTMCDIVLYLSLETILRCLDDPLDHPALLPVPFIERVLRMIFEGSFPTRLPSLKTALVSPRFIEQNTV